MWQCCYVKLSHRLLFQLHGYIVSWATLRLMKPNAVSSGCRTVLFFLAPEKADILEIWAWDLTAMNSTHNVYKLSNLHCGAKPNAVGWDPEKMRLLERCHKVSIFWGEFFILRQQVFETDGVPRPASVWLENNGASKRNVLVQALLRLATCLWI